MVHDRADWRSCTDPMEALHRLMFPEAHDGGPMYEWDGADLLEEIARVVKEHTGAWAS